MLGLKEHSPRAKGDFFFLFFGGRRTSNYLGSITEIHEGGGVAHINRQMHTHTHTESCRISTAGGSHRRAAAAKFALILPPPHRLHATEFMNVISVRWFAVCRLKYGGRDGISAEPRFPSLRRAPLMRSRGAITAFAWALLMSRRDVWSLWCVEVYWRISKLFLKSLLFCGRKEEKKKKSWDLKRFKISAGRGNFNNKPKHLRINWIFLLYFYFLRRRLLYCLLFPAKGQWEKRWWYQIDYVALF